ncbi:MAG TPA: PaaI family thioesterase [Alphaproteobacteria bacterium]
MSHYIPKNPDFEARVRDSFSRQGAMALIGAEIVHLAPGACDIAVSYRPDLSQQHNFFHGGVVGMIADSAGGYAAFSLMPADASVLTVEYKINLVAPADGHRLIARGRVIKPGRTLTVCCVDTVVERDGREHLCATMLQTLMTMAGRADGPKG